MAAHARDRAVASGLVGLPTAAAEEGAFDPLAFVASGTAQAPALGNKPVPV